MKKIANKLSWLTIITAGIFTGSYFFTAITRLLYPYDLDFIEDGLLLTALRLAEGQSVFIAPHADFAPHVYMPLYMWLGSLLFKLTGPGFLPLRLLSFLATLAVCGLIFRIARRESKVDWLALSCAGLFLVGYRINGFWYELARVDSLFVALSLAGLAVGVYGGRSRFGLLAAAGLLALAFWTKQTGLMVAVGLGLFLLFRQGRRSWPFWLTIGLLTVPPALLLNRQTDGWFLYYTFHIARLNPIEPGRIASFIGVELAGLMGSLTLMTLASAGLAWRRHRSNGLTRQPWLLFIGLGIIISGMGRASVGGNVNNRMLAYTLLCLAPALLWRAWSSPRLPEWRTSAIAILMLMQFASGVYNPTQYIATFAMRSQGETLVKKIVAIDGNVLVMMHPWYAYMAGKEPSAQIAALWHARQRGALPLPADLVTRLKNQQYAAIISDESLFETEPALQQLLTAYYIPAEILPAAASPPTIAGMPVRPQIIYRPKP